jgi:hypothetical protein
MRTELIINRTVRIASFALILGIPWVPIQAADQPLTAAITSAPAIVSVPTGEASQMASGAVEDTLRACMARIPEDASAGQRMVAEESCNRDEGARSLSQVAPQF